MIKINLLSSYGPVEAIIINDESEIKQSQPDFIKKLVILLLGPIALFVYEKINIPELITQTQALQKDVEEKSQYNQQKEKIVAEIKKHEEEKKNINQKIEFLNDITNKRKNILNLLSYIKQSTPEKVWLNRIKVEGTVLEIAGETDSNSEANTLLEKLATSNLLRDVNFIDKSTRAETEKDLGLTIQTFIISGQLVHQEASP